MTGKKLLSIVSRIGLISVIICALGAFSLPRQTTGTTVYAGCYTECNGDTGGACSPKPQSSCYESRIVCIRVKSGGTCYDLELDCLSAGCIADYSEWCP